jgi:2-polyprenyl-6-methoxyphenol hydroxylase-like FAD-dependent oxidoreductase
MPTHPLHVIIIGGGIGGLCLAQGLRKAGVSVAVYERDRAPDARLQGYRLSIEPPGSGALHECLPPQLWQILVALSGDPGARMGVFDEQLHQLMEEDAKAGATDAASGSHAMSRVTLRTVLLAGLDDVVHFDEAFVRYEPSSGGTVVAHFADGSSATGDVLVGADGARSRVRQQLLPEARRIDVPAIGVGGKLPLGGGNEAWLPARLTATKNMILPWRDFLFTAVFRRREHPDALTDRMGDRLRSAGLDADLLLREAEDDDYIMWAFVAHRRSFPTDIAGIAGLYGEPLREVVAGRMDGWHPVLRRLIAGSDPDTVEQFDFAAAARVKPWPSSNVTLLGDAIHFMPPVGGMGGNAALHDARLLCHALTTAAHDRSPLLPALRTYEAEMLDRGFQTVRGVRLYTDMAISQTRALRAVARGFFRLCGAVGPLRRAVFSD